MRLLRVSDVAIVSDEPPGLNNRVGSQGPLDWLFEDETVECRPGASPDYGMHQAPLEPSNRIGL